MWERCLLFQRVTEPADGKNPVPTVHNWMSILPKHIVIASCIQKGILSPKSPLRCAARGLQNYCLSINYMIEGYELAIRVSIPNYLADGHLG